MIFLFGQEHTPGSPSTRISVLPSRVADRLPRVSSLDPQCRECKPILGTVFVQYYSLWREITLETKSTARATDFSDTSPSPASSPKCASIHGSPIPLAIATSQTRSSQVRSSNQHPQIDGAGYSARSAPRLRPPQISVHLSVLARLQDTGGNRFREGSKQIPWPLRGRVYSQKTSRRPKWG